MAVNFETFFRLFFEYHEHNLDSVILISIIGRIKIGEITRHS